MINVLDRWMQSSINNFNIFVGLTMILAVVSVISIFYFLNKIGNLDERTSIVQLKIIKVMFSTLILLLGVYISWVDSTIIYFRQFLILVISLSFLAGAITSAIEYRKDIC